MFMCKTHFTTVPSETREGWKQYRGTRTFPETKIAVECRPGPNRGGGVTTGDGDPGYSNCPEDEKVKTSAKNSMWPGKVYSVLYQVRSVNSASIVWSVTPVLLHWLLLLLLNKKRHANYVKRRRWEGGGGAVDITPW